MTGRLSSASGPESFEDYFNLEGLRAELLAAVGTFELNTDGIVFDGTVLLADA